MLCLQGMQAGRVGMLHYGTLHSCRHQLVLTGIEELTEGLLHHGWAAYTARLSMH